MQTPRRHSLADDATLLAAAIAALPAPIRETLMLRELHGLAYREIAAVTGVPVPRCRDSPGRGVALSRS
jgi:DNA-directed RNA polymerase specialized sigma24 family protein